MIITSHPSPFPPPSHSALFYRPSSVFSPITQKMHLFTILPLCFPSISLPSHTPLSLSIFPFFLSLSFPRWFSSLKDAPIWQVVISAISPRSILIFGKFAFQYWRIISFMSMLFKFCPCYFKLSHPFSYFFFYLLSLLVYQKGNK